MNPSSMLYSLTILAILLLGSFPASAQYWEQALRAGGVDADQGSGVAVDAAGNVYLTGTFEGAVAFGSVSLTSAGEQDVFVVKLDSEGQLLWAVRGGGSDDDYGFGIALDAYGNTYVTGRFSGTATFGAYTLTGSGLFLVKYSPEGAVLWARRNDGEGGNDVAVDASGNAYVTGAFYGTATFGTFTLTSVGSSDVFVVKYGTNGEVLWARRGGGAGMISGQDLGSGISVDEAGGVYVTGYFLGTATFGAFTLVTAGLSDVFVVKYDATGEELWARRGGGTASESGVGIAAVGADGAYVTGYFSGAATFGSYTLTTPVNDEAVFVVKYSSAGDVLWARSAGGTGGMDNGGDIVADATGAAYVTGRFWERATFGPYTLDGAGDWDFFVAKYASDGEVLWVHRGGGRGEDVGGGVAVDGAGGVYATGFFRDTARFGPYTLDSAGYNDLFVVKIGSDAAAVTLSAAPASPPIVIPHTGGSFAFTTTLTNVTDQSQRMQAWTSVTGPIGQDLTLGPAAVVLPPGGSFIRGRMQAVPASAPAGTYTYFVHIGSFPYAIASDSFTFVKSPAATGSLQHTDHAAAFVRADWEASGWDGTAAPAARAELGLPDGYALSEPHPNPFSTGTRLSLRLAEAQRVTAEVLDALGRRVAVLHDGPMTAEDAHPLVFDAGTLPSGHYVVRVTGERFTTARRLVLVR